jgi:hypothetical protein
MSWTTPKTWVNDETLTADDMNTHLRDNLNALKAPLSLNVTTTGGDVLIGFHGTILHSAGYVAFDVLLDNATRLGGDDGLVVTDSGGLHPLVSFVRLVTGLSAGAHNFKLQWRTNTGAATLYAGAGTTNLDMHGQFWVREVS